MVHQELELALKRSVSENLWLGRYPKIGLFVSDKKMHEATREIFARLGMTVSPKRIMETVPVAQRQMTEIAKAVSYNAKVIVFDEPTSSLTEEEVGKLRNSADKLKSVISQIQF